MPRYRSKDYPGFGRKIVAAISILTAATIIIALLFVGAAAGTIKCNHCGQAIRSGVYLQVDKDFYHQDHFLCTGCNQPITGTRFVPTSGRYYHTECHRQLTAPRCELCRKIIDGQYMIYNGNNYHDRCYTDGVALRCDFCDEIINGSYLASYWGDRYHKSHGGVVPECDYCGRMIGDKATGGGLAYTDGRHVCNLCDKTTVNDFDEASQLFDDVRRRLEQLGIVIDHDDLNLQLATSGALARQSDDLGGEHSGLTTHEFTTLGGLIVHRRFSISILEAMPRICFASTAAHEMMHVWLYLNAPLELDSALREGSCNYASLLLLSQFDSPEAEYLIDNLWGGKSVTYGDGFRRVEKLVNDYGVPGWLNYLSANQEFPGGY